MAFLIGSRAARSGDDPIFALNAEARKRALAGEQVINATVGALLDDDGKLAVLPGMAEALRAVPTAVAAGYAPIAGSDDFLRAVLGDLFGDRTTSGWATGVATPGGTGALRLAVTSFLEPGQAMLTSSFYWGPYQTIADEAERRLETFRMFDEAGRLDVADFEKHLARQRETQGRALVFLNSPCHNPTGYSFDEAEQKAIAEVIAREAARCPVAVLLDIAYARYGAADPRHFMDRLINLDGQALVLLAWSASKAFTLYGQRVGALVAVHPEASERVHLKNALAYGCRGTWSNCNASGMAAVTRVLSDPELRARVDQERAALKSILDHRVARWNQLAGPARLPYPRYDGGFFTTVFCDDPDAACTRLKAEGVFVVPVTTGAAPPSPRSGLPPGALRVALCSVAERDIPRLVDAMARALA